MSRSRMLAITVILVSASMLLLSLADVQLTALRLLFALPLVLVLPGYLCTAAALPHHRFRVVERLLLSVGVSLVVVVLGGLLLQLMPWGLTALAWSVYLSAVTLLAGGIAWRRRPLPVLSTPRKPITLGLRQGVLLGIAGLLLLSAGVVARIGAEEQRVARFTQFWLLPSKQQEEDQIRLGITNEELQPLHYRVELLVAGFVVQEWPSIALEQGERWQATATLPQVRQNNELVTAQLYRLDEPDVVYRRVKLWRGNGEE